MFSSKKSIVGITLTLSLCKVKIVTLGSKYSNNSKQLSHYSPARHLVTLVTIYDNTTYGGDSGAVFAIRKCYTFCYTASRLYRGVYFNSTLSIIVSLTLVGISVD